MNDSFVAITGEQQECYVVNTNYQRFSLFGIAQCERFHCVTVTSLLDLHHSRFLLMMLLEGKSCIVLSVAVLCF